MTALPTSSIPPREFFTEKVLGRVRYKDWRFGVRPMNTVFGGYVGFPEDHLVVYISYPHDGRPEELREYYQFKFWLHDDFLDREVYDIVKWMFEYVIMHIERLFAEASFLYGNDYLMLTDDSIEIVRWEIVRRYSR